MTLLSFKTKRFQLRHRGLSLTELAGVFVIAGLLIYLILSSPPILCDGNGFKAKRKAALAQIKIFMGAIDNFKIDAGVYPDNSTGLQALVEQPADLEGWDPAGYLNATIVPLDPWGYEYVYHYTGEGRPPYEIYSYGADGDKGGNGNDADVSSFELISGDVEY